ncbi:hypothetical protein E2C01_016777 [Portunus trituberculatus]|uniref:Uncharacterized protein n=1 Tax=Portunus trituberculatus TaxID=210409 RepID=A0A5B7DRF9_PORTR|nr:hypothetical protein [Portunus trituberculatus]
MGGILWGAHRLAYPMASCFASLHAGSLPTPSNSHQQASTCRETERVLDKPECSGEDSENDDKREEEEEEKKEEEVEEEEEESREQGGHVNISYSPTLTSPYPIKMAWNPLSSNPPTILTSTSSHPPTPSPCQTFSLPPRTLRHPSTSAPSPKHTPSPSFTFPPIATQPAPIFHPTKLSPLP